MHVLTSENDANVSGAVKYKDQSISIREEWELLKNLDYRFCDITWDV